MSQSKYKVAAFDLDGTLLNSEKKILPSTRAAIRKLESLGVHIVLASGRHPHGILHVAEDLKLTGHDSYLLGFNGGTIVSLKDGSRVFDHQMSIALAQKAADAAVSLGLSPVTYTETEILCLDNDNPYVKFEALLNKLPIRQITSFREEVTFPVNKLLVVGDPADIANGKEEALQKMLKETCTVSKSAPFFLEVMPNGIDKAFGLENLLKLLGEEKEALAAFGDGMNDKPMIDYAAMGIVMANGADALKASADFITHSCDEDGIAYAVDQLFC